MAYSKVVKVEAISKIAEMRGEGKSIREICAAIGLGKTMVSNYIRTFGITKLSQFAKCPHCGLAIDLNVRHPL